MSLDSYYTDPEVAAAYDDQTVGAPGEIPFFVGLARAAATRGESVLELACGTGRVTIPMAETGARTTGLDNSVAMLHIAERKAEAAGVDVTWVQGDMAAFDMDERFGLVTIPCRSFLMLTSGEAQKRCLERIREHLMARGLLALNIFNPDLALIAGRLGERADRWERDRSGGLARREFHTGEQLLVETRRDNSDPTDQARTIRARWIYRYEMQYLLELSGFAVEGLYGGFEGQPFDEASTEMVWVARRA
jgi:SAM-dependent methyltransferase